MLSIYQQYTTQHQDFAMLLSHPHKFIQLKTVKTAGTSIEIYFQRYCATRGKISKKTGTLISAKGIVASRSCKSHEKAIWHEHMTAREARDNLGPITWDTYLKFCSVRNPYDRAVSWFYFRMGKHAIHDLAKNDLQRCFEKFTLKSFGSDREIYCIDDQLTMDDWICYDNMGNDMARICDKIGVPWEPELMGNNLSHYRPANSEPSRLFTETARAHVANVCSVEIDLFGWEFPKS